MDSVASRPLGPSLLVVLALFVLPTGHAAAAETRPHVVQPGDELIVGVADPRPREIKAQVDVRGDVTVGSYGQIHVGGLTIVRARDAIRQALGRYLVKTSGITVTLGEARTLVIISGKVVRPGPVRVPEPADIWQAIQEAGGAAEGADLGRVVLGRGGALQTVDVRAFLTRDNDRQLPLLEGGDVLFVPADAAYPQGPSSREVFLSQRALETKVFVLGAVVSQGMVERSPGLTPLMAIGLAGGPTSDADLSAVRILTADRSEIIDVTGRLAGTRRVAGPIAAEGGVVVYVPRRGGGAHDPLVQHVNVFGWVRTPGWIEVAGSLSLLDVVALAGGPAEEADLDEVRLVRSGPGFTLATRYDMERFFEEGGVVAQVLVEPGDSVFVGERINGLEIFSQVLSSLIIISSAATSSAALFLGLRGQSSTPCPACPASQERPD